MLRYFSFGYRIEILLHRHFLLSLTQSLRHILSTLIELFHVDFFFSFGPIVSKNLAFKMRFCVSVVTPSFGSKIVFCFLRLDLDFACEF